MRVIFINPPKFSKYLINFLSLFYKEKFFLNHGDLEINSYLIKKNIKPVDFSHIQSNNIKNYIFGDSSIYKHTKSFFFKNFEIFFKRNFSKNLKKKTILLSLHESIIPLSNFTSRLSIWLKSQKKMQTTVFFFHSKFYYAPPINKKTKKIILPLNFFYFDFKYIINKFKFQRHSLIKEKKNQQNTNRVHKKKLLYIVNQSLQYGSNKYKLFQKDLIIEKKSQLMKFTDIFIYGNELIFNNKLQLIKNLYTSIIFLIKILVKIKNFKNILLAIYFFKLFFRTKKFFNYIKDKKYYCCYVDYDILLPSYIYFALKSLNIKVFSYQERFNLGFKLHRISVFTDHYFINNNYQIQNLKKSNYITAETFQSLKQIRSELIRSYPKKKKNIITVFGYTTSNNEIRSKHEPLTSFQSQNIFLKDFINLSKTYKKYKFILRFKSLEWLKNDFFKSSIKEINNLKNIEISRNYTFNESYKLCSESFLIICRWTSLIDEALAARKKVLIYDYSANSSPITKEYFNYGNKIICSNFKELKNKLELLIQKRKNFNTFLPKKNLIEYYGKVNNVPNYTKNIIRNELEKHLFKIESRKKI